MALRTHLLAVLNAALIGLMIGAAPLHAQELGGVSRDTVMVYPSPDFIGYTYCDPVLNEPVFWQLAQTVYHETRHVQQLTEMGCDKWEDYLRRPEKRFENEVDAYCHAVNEVRRNYPREAPSRTIMLNMAARNLSSDVYGERAKSFRQTLIALVHKCGRGN
jgi:hypothetical protein